MLAPLLKDLARHNPGVRFTMAAPALLEPLFGGVDNLHYCPVNKKDGLWRIFRQLRALRPTHVADMHNVLRTRLLSLEFCLNCIPVRHLRKGRAARRRLVRPQRKCLQALRSMHQRYIDVLRRLPVDLPPFPTDYYPVRKPLEGPVRLGLAPFAAHAGKRWPGERVRELLSLLTATGRYEVFLFGGGKQELAAMEAWAADFPHVRAVSSPKRFVGELEVMGSLHLMVSMDSANMHFASCLGLPVLSLWGATHPYAGFYPWRQDPALALQLPLACRPCSVFGNKPCLRGDYACWQGLTAQACFDKIEGLFA